MTALGEAARLGRPEVIHLLLGVGAEANQQAGEEHRTPLAIAISHGHMAAVSCFLKAGANVNTPSLHDGRTAMHIAAAIGPGDAASAALAQLIAHGGEVEATCSAGKTPLHYAMMKGNVSATLFLLESGASTGAERAQELCTLSKLPGSDRISTAKRPPG